MNSKLNKISPNLWFDKNAEEATKYYVSVFKDSKIRRITRYGKERYEIPGINEGDVMTIEFSLEGQDFVALNGGPIFKFNEAISFIIKCDSQEEIDYYWDHLSMGGDDQAQSCGWLKDQFGVSWQIVPSTLTDMINNPDSEKSARVMKALLQMKKIDLKALLDVYKG